MKKIRNLHLVLTCFPRQAYQSKNNQTCFLYIDKATFSAVQVTADSPHMQMFLLIYYKKRQSQSCPDEMEVRATESRTCWPQTHTCLTAIFPGLPGSAGTRKVKPTGFYWSKRQWVAVASAWPDMQVCTSLQTYNHASTSPLSFFTGRMPFLPPNQQRQSTEGNTCWPVIQLSGIYQYACKQTLL